MSDPTHEENTSLLTIRLPRVLRESLDARAEREDVPVSVLVRGAITADLIAWTSTGGHAERR